MKPTEGLNEASAEAIRKLCKKNGGCWIWLCSSKSTDIAPPKQKKSYVYGAVYISHVISTTEFNKLYQKQRLKSEYQHSKAYKYQAIIPSHDYARLELKHPIEVHSPEEGECRWSGVWNMHKNAKLLKVLKDPVFV